MAKKLKTSVQRGRYYKFYKKLITSKMIFNPIQLKPGYIINLKYKSEERSSPKESIYIVLQSGFEKKLHLLDLDYIKPDIFNRIVKMITQTGEPTTQTIKKSPFVILEFKVEKQPLYNSLKHVDSTVIKSFRTLEISKVKDLHLINLNIGLATDKENMNKDTKDIKEENEDTTPFEISDRDNSILKSISDKVLKTVNGKSTKDEDDTIGKFLEIN